MSEYFEKYKQSIIITANKDEYLTLRSIDANYHYCSDKALKMLGISKPSQIMGKDLRNSYANVKNIFLDFKFLDNECIRSKTNIEAIGLLDFVEEGLGLYTLSIFPILDNNKNLLGFKDTLKRIYQIDYFFLNTLNSYLQINTRISKNSTFETIISPSFKLTSKEYLILFLLVFGFNVKQISSFISVNGGANSVSTIRNIIHKQLFAKFNVNSLIALIEKAYHLEILTEKLPELFKNYQFLRKF